MSNPDWSFLPPEHRPGGSRALHDDWIWPFKWVPRTWTSFKIPSPPKMIWGNQRYWSLFTTGQVLQDCDPIADKFGPKPIPRPGEFQLSLVPIIDQGQTVRLPYFALTTKSGWHFRVLARWTDPSLDCPYSYVTYPDLAIKKLEV